MSGTGFKDHFSGHADAYTRYRPGYPEKLFKTLAALAPDADRVWDCATGNGQAALGFAPLFARVEATDASAEQIANAQPHSKVRYSVAPAEASGLEERSVSLISVAQALHWFDFGRFYTEVRRVAKPDALLACWSYELCEVTPAFDKVVERLYADLGDSYWPPERKHVETKYRDIPFPFAEVVLPVINMHASWTLEHYLGYLRTWSAVRAYIKKNDRDPVAEIETELTSAWGDPARERKIAWPLNILAGYVP